MQTAQNAHYAPRRGFVRCPPVSRGLHLLFLLCVLCCASRAGAEEISLAMSDNLVARAEFRAGDPKKPAVILLHGFLQTHHFPTISRLVESLSGEGYTVLAPTLTLNITHRKQSTPCEAIHRHTAASTAAELNAWVKWLKARKPRYIVLAGHSLGNITNLAYLSHFPDSDVSQFIGVSIIEGSLKAGEGARAGLVRDLRERARRNPKALVEQQFSFCQKYRATPASLLSYLEWGPDRLLSAINASKIPVTMIMGSQDERLGKGWTERLKKSAARVIIIEGANHFMDGEHEFDLLDSMLAELKREESAHP